MADERISFRAASMWRLFLPLAMLVAISVLVNREAWTRVNGLIYGVFAGTLVLARAAHFLLRRYYFLEFAPAGLTVATLGRQRFVPWSEIEGVDFARRDGAASAAHVILLKLRRASALRKIVGGDLSSLAVYDRTPAKIVALLRARLETA